MCRIDRIESILIFQESERNWKWENIRKYTNSSALWYWNKSHCEYKLYIKHFLILFRTIINWIEQNYIQFISPKRKKRKVLSIWILFVILRNSLKNCSRLSLSCFVDSRKNKLILFKYRKMGCVLNALALRFQYYAETLLRMTIRWDKNEKK